MGKISKGTLKETLLYLVFGVLTTAVNYVVFVVWLQIFSENDSLLANTVAFVISMTFAYITNKRFVFQTKSWRFEVLKREIPSFFAARIFSFLLEQLGLFISTSLLHLDDTTLFGYNTIYFVKLGLNVIVVILNYIFSKFWIFKKKE